MVSKNPKNTKNPPPLGNLYRLILWGVLLGITLIRLIVATSGSLGEKEAFLTVCAAHPAAGYVEGPCGVPLLTSLLLLWKPIFTDSALLALRWISPLAALLLSWCVWWFARRIAPRAPAIAFWSVISVNLLSWVNLSSLVMDGSMVTASLVVLCMVTGWNAVDTQVVKKKNPLLPWIIFGVALGLGTIFYYPIGFLLPIVVLAKMLFHRGKKMSWLGTLLALALLLLGWLAPLIWNARHDWISWSSVARGFDSYTVGSLTITFSLLVAISSLLIPLVLSFVFSTIWARGMMLIVLIGLSAISLVVLAMPSELQGGYPSPLGVQGMGELAKRVVTLQKERSDSKGKPAFLIAETPGLAALLGERIHCIYPECLGAPSVFVTESPSLSSSYALWPSYADSQAPQVRDILYTQENTVSSFVGRNALYITTETKADLPQAITGAFDAVGLLKEVMITKNGQPETIRIYQCEAYHSLSL